MNLLTSQLHDTSNHFTIKKLDSTTVEVVFSGPNAADNAEKFSKLDLNVLNSADLASPTLKDPTTTAAPEEGSGNMAMFAGIAIAGVVVLAGVAFLAYRYKKSSAGDGQKLNFNLDYDEEAFLGKYGDEMESMSAMRV